jgi:ferric-dicitrate binding protein FerR (iron transport regulator)
MDSNHYISLLIARFKGEITPVEAAELDRWLAATPENRRLAADFEKTWQASENYELPLTLDEDAAFATTWQKVNPEIKAIPDPTTGSEGAKIVPISRHRSFWWAAAAGLVLLVTAGWWLLGGEKSAEKTLVAGAQNLEATLPDGSKIWLRQSSKLTFPEKFGANERYVQLEGEAFFEVEKDTARPFKIATRTALITVLGTAFNVRQLTGESRVEVSVREGKVRLEDKNTSRKLVLIANQTGILDIKKGEVKAFADENLNALAWQRKRLIFRDTPLEEAVADLENFYNQRIEIAEPALKKCPVTSRFDTARPLETALDELTQSLGMTLEKTTDGAFVLRGGTCR